MPPTTSMISFRFQMLPLLQRFWLLPTDVLPVIKAAASGLRRVLAFESQALLAFARGKVCLNAEPFTEEVAWLIHSPCLHMGSGPTVYTFG